MARLAQEQGLDEEISKTLIELANQEIYHAEFEAKKNIKTQADKVRAAVFEEIADQMKIFSQQEYHHGEVLKNLIEKFKSAEVETILFAGNLNLFSKKKFNWRV